MKRVLSLFLSILMVLSVITFSTSVVTAESNELISKGSVWSYYWNKDITEALPEGWFEADFDASGWTIGKAEFGNEWRGSKVTDLSNMHVALFVKDFTVTNCDDIKGLTLSIVYDQDPVVYINGNKVWSADGYHDHAYLTVDLTAYVNLLKEGQNRISVYTDNINSDGAYGGGACFDMSLVADCTMEIASGSEWAYNYVVGEEENLPENWYADKSLLTSWEKASAHFTSEAYGNSAIATTILPIDHSEIVKAGFMTTFNLDSVSNVGTVTLGMFYDQDPVVYINGTQVFSASGYNTSLTAFDITAAAKPYLVDGENMIAVYVVNPVGGYGFNFDAYLNIGYPDTSFADADGYVKLTGASGEGCYAGDAEGLGGYKNVLDGNQNSMFGGGFNAGMNVKVDLIDWTSVSEVTLWCKNEGTTTNPDGKTYGHYNIYVGKTLVAENVPAIQQMNGGYTVKLTTPVTGKNVTVEVMDWTGTGWAGIADVFVKGTKGEAPTAPVIEDLAIDIYGKGLENWGGGSNGNATQLLLTSISGLNNNVWQLNISGTVVTMKPSSIYDFNNGSCIYRFETCMNEIGNQFIPVNGEDYTVSAIVYNDDDFPIYQSNEVTVSCNFEPVVPTVSIIPYYGEIENWGGKTYFIVGTVTSNNSNPALYEGIRNGEYTVQVLIVDETTGETYAIPKYAFDSGNDLDGSSFMRIAPCDYGINPVYGHAYTIALTVYDGDKIIYTGVSETGAFDKYNEAFTESGSPIVPDIAPHSYVDFECKFEGYQIGNDNASIRFIGSVNTLAYETIDLLINVKGMNKSYSLPANKVFKVLNGGGGVAASVKGSNAGGQEIDAEYLFGYAITGIPAGTYTFEIIPTVTTTQGDVVRGISSSVTITLG